MKRTLLVKVEHPFDEIGNIFVELSLPESRMMNEFAMKLVKDGLKFTVTDVTDKKKEHAHD